MAQDSQMSRKSVPDNHGKVPGIAVCLGCSSMDALVAGKEWVRGRVIGGISRKMEVKDRGRLRCRPPGLI